MKAPEPFKLEETGETWTGTAVCLVIAYVVIPIVFLIGPLVYWVLS